MYALIGKATVRLALVYVRRRYGRQLKLGFVGLAAAAAVGVAYLASRDAPEG